jgi:hypothetical protein
MRGEWMQIGFRCTWLWMALDGFGCMALTILDTRQGVGSMVQHDMRDDDCIQVGNRIREQFIAFRTIGWKSSQA